MLLTLLAGAGSIALPSPDRATRIEIASDGSSLSVSREGEQILAASPLGLEFSGTPDFSRLRLAGIKRATVRRTIPLTASKARSALDHYNSALIAFRESTGSRRTLPIEARAHKATVWQNGAEPNDVGRTSRKVRRGETMTMKMSGGSGATAIFEPTTQSAAAAR